LVQAKAIAAKMRAAVYRNSPATPWFALTFAIVAGVLLAIGHSIPGVVLAVIAIVIYWLHIRYDRGKSRAVQSAIALIERRTSRAGGWWLV
jgi:hypothetical protein